MVKEKKSLVIITLFIIILGLAASLTGLFYTNDGEVFHYVNQYGETIKINGNGLYANDSYFMAPIFRGTDFTILVMAIPMLMIALFLDIKKKTMKSRTFLTSVIAVFTYYSTSIALGVTYNRLHLVYIALFSFSLFGLIIAIESIDKTELKRTITGSLPYRGYYIFLALSGVALIAAWMPDIIISLLSNSSLAYIENYTTSITNVLDMGIIGPVAFITLYQLVKRNGIGYLLAGIMFTVCIVIGVMLPIQTLFQLRAGIELPLPALISKVASFVILALFAFYFDIRLFRAMNK